MKKLLFLFIAANVALRNSFVRLAFLAIVLTLSSSASAQVNYCSSPVLNTTSVETLNFTCKKTGATTYQIKLDFVNATSGTITDDNFYVDGTGGANIQIGALTPVWTNSNKTATYTFNTFTTAATPNIYVATIFVIIGGTERRWDLPTNENLQATCQETTPLLSTTAATSVGTTVGTMNGNISSSGASSITSYGFYWSTTAGFADGAGTQVVTGTTNTTGNITSSLTGLNSGTTYYYKAYATNTQGTAYGLQQSFTTVGSLYINDNSLTGDIWCTAVGQNIGTANGTVSLPYKNVTDLFNDCVVASGTIINIDAGTYSGRIVFSDTEDGVAGNVITIKGAGIVKTILTSSLSAGSFISTGGADYMTFQDFSISNNTETNAIFVTGTSTNCTFNNLNISVIGHGIQVDGSGNNNTTIAKNIINGNNGASNYGIFFSGTTASSGHSIINNTVFNFAHTFRNQNTAVINTNLYHNSFYAYEYGCVAYLTGWNVKNNIFYTTSNNSAHVSLWYGDVYSPTTLNNNLYYNPNAAQTITKYGTNVTYATLAAFKTANPAFEVNGVEGNPLYVNTASVATTDLHLQPASPAIGVGSNVGVTDDIDGNARPLGGTFDIGADETIPGVPTITNFPAISKVMGDAPFPLTQPTSNSAGAWTYSITVGNNTVATISGTTVTLVAPGTATLRATQAADGSYSSGFIEATLTVTPSSVPLAGPTAPPTRNSWDVLSQYGSAYSNQPGVIFDNFAPGSTIVGDVTLADNSVVKKYTNHSYSGISPNSSNNLNVSGMTHLHMDVWSPDFASFKVKLQGTNGSNNEIEVPFTKVQGVWNSYDIPLSTYTGVTLANLQWIVPVTYNPNNTTLYITNVYFYRPATTLPPTLGEFTVPAKLIGDAAFTLTPPTSNSAGAFTYSSNNSAVATISGSTVTVVGAGSATITASQAADGVYGSGSTTATLSVTPPAAPAPPARNSWDVISLYSDSYTTSSSASWGAVGTGVTISGNNTRFLSGSPTYRLGFSATNISAMTTLHIDVYALNQNSWQFRLNDKAVVIGTPINGWTSVDILLSAYAPHSLDLTNVSFFDFFNPLGANPNSSYLDNIYFYRAATTQPPTIGALTVPSPKVLGDDPFILTNPTSNSSGAWTYSSSPAGVVTFSGNTVTIISGGTTTITATQAANGSYGTGTASASLVVNFAAPGASPIPPARGSENVVSMFTGSPSVYADPSSFNMERATWSGATLSTIANGTNTCLKVDNFGFLGYVTSTEPVRFSAVGMTKLHVDIYLNTPISNMFIFLLSNGDLLYETGALLAGWNSLDITLSTAFPSANLASIYGFKFEHNQGAARQIYLDNIYFYNNKSNWIGTNSINSTDWATPGNWASGTVPTAISDVVIASSANQPIIGSDVSVNSLTINTGASLTVNSGYNLTVANAIANSGTMTLQNNANLLQSAATTNNSNSGNIIVKRNSASLLRLDHTLWSSPVGSQNLYGFSPTTLTNRFYTYNTGSNGYVTTGLSSATTFTAGKGYAVRAPNDYTAITPTPWEGTFTGIPNNGTVPFTLDTSGIGFNLVGNPYPSPISATTFLTENSSKINGTLYFYAHSLPMNANGTFPIGTNYGAWNSGTGGVAATRANAGIPHNISVPVAPTGIIQVGQGFFVKATNAGTINFTNTMRVGNNANQFFRTTEIERHRLWLNLTTESGTDINQIAVAYVEGATQNADTNFDGLSFGNTGSMLSSKINGSDYVIQGRSLPFASNDIVPLGFKASAAGNYKIILTDKDGLFLGNQDVFVRDNLMGIEHNIKVSPYTFASEIGTFDARFQLVYTQMLGTPSSSFTPNSVLVYKNTDGFHVTTNGIVMKDILVYDISGRLIFKQANINGTATILKGLSQTRQVLLLKITSQENETVTVKAIN